MPTNPPNPPTTPPPEADKPKPPTADAKPPTKEETRLPPKFASLRGGDLERAKIWASQSKAGTITLCCEKGCYYPLVAKRDPKNHNDPIVKRDENGKVYTSAVCSWDPSHGGGSQAIYPKLKDDELDPSKL